MASRYSRSYVVIVLLATVLGLFAPVLLQNAVAVVRNFVFDTFQRAAPRPWNPELPIRIVDIDEESIRRVGQWPWPRARLGELVDRLRERGAAVIAFDIVLSEPDRTNIPNLIATISPPELRDQIARELENVPTSDMIFAGALARQPVVLGAIATNARQGGNFAAKFGIARAGDGSDAAMARFDGALLPLDIFVQPAAGLGALNWLPDTDQIVRTVPLLLRAGEATLPGLALEALRVAQDASTYVVRATTASGEASFAGTSGITGIRVGELQIPTGSRGDVRVRFSQHQPGRFIPAWRILESKAGDEPAMDGAVIFVGASAEGLLDQRATPLDPLVPGVEVHAQVAESLLEGALLTRPDWAPGLEIVAAAMLCGLVFALVKLFHPLVMAAISCVIVAVLVGGSWYLFASRSLLVDAAYPGGSMLMALGVGVIHSLWAETSQKREIRNAFERFVSPAVVARLSRDPSRLVLGGEIREITILFSDMRGFTSLSETMDAQELTRFMNEYLTPMSDLVLEFGGTIDKYIGDAIMAFWNAPLDDPDHARHAATAALAMQAELVTLNQRWQAQAALLGKTFPTVSTGIGLHLGSCCVGNLGSARRFDYSAIGDPVNVASRLESATKGLGLGLLVSAAVQAMAPELAWLEIGYIRLKGKNADIRAYTCLGDAALRQSDAFCDFAARQTAFLVAYAAGAMAQAETISQTLATFGETDFSRLRAFYRDQAEAGYERIDDRPCFVLLDK